MSKNYKKMTKSSCSRKGFAKSLSMMTIAAVLIANSTVSVFAKEVSKEKVSKDGVKVLGKEVNKKDREPGGKKVLDDEKVLGKEKISDTERIERAESVSYSETRKYTFKELNALSYSDLIKTIKSIKYGDVPELFQFNNDSYEFYKNENRVQALIDALTNIGQTYTKEDDQGIETVVEFLRSAFYLGYYNQQLKYLNTREFQNRCIPAIKAIENNPNFGLGTKTQDKVVENLGSFIGNTICNPETVNGVIKIFDQYDSNLVAYSKENSKGRAIYALMKGIDYQIVNVDLYGTAPKDTIFYGKIDGYIGALERVALLGNRLTSDNKWFAENGIYFTGRMGNLRNDPRISQKALTDAMMIYPYLSSLYYTAAERLDENFDGKNSNGVAIDLEALKELGKEKYLSKNYTFDNGTFVVRAGDKVSEEKIKRLYWAANEVKAQYHRVVGNDKPLEAGNPDDILKVVIYNSPEEYEMNLKLYGYETDNGGMYIEGIGTFFTYERTPEESRYTLEELFRHEYTHYLQARYVVPGMWNEGEFYKDGALTWYEEGTAEFFAGATRTGGILPRQSVASYLDQDEASRLSLKQLLYSRYGTWDFYHYGFAFSNYMYNKNVEMLQRMTSYIKKNNAEDYKKYIKELSEDSNLNKEYQKYIDDLLANYDNLTVPLVSDDYTKSHPEKSNNEIVNEIDSVLDLNNITTEINKSMYFNTFNIQGTFVGGKATNEDADWKTMNKNLDEVLKKLENSSWSGYKTLTAYFTDYKVNSDGNYEFKVNFHGLSTDTKVNVENKLPIADGEVDATGVTNEAVKFNGEKSRDEDGTIKEYLWDFGDGTTSKEVKGTHNYEKEGVYKVTLKVTDDKGGQSEKVFEVKIVKGNSSGRTIETEPNNEFKQANGDVVSGQTISASFTKGDSSDKFYFDVEKDGEVTIDVKNPNGLGINWTLYKEGDLNKYIAYALKDGTSLINKVKLAPGRYYLNVYNYDSNKLGDYTLTITGGLKGSLEDGVIKEVEGNNSFDKAMAIKKGNTVNAYIDDNDYEDIYSFTSDGVSDVEILLEKQDNIKVNWLLYHESDLKNYVAYANINGNTLKNTYKGKPGKYYIHVYKHDTNTAGSYTLNLK